MKKTLMAFLLLVMVVTITSCGGGGGGATGGNTSGGDSSSLVITMTPTVTSLPANTLNYPEFIGSPFETQINIRVAYGNGQGVTTGTIVHLQTSDGSIGYVGIPDDPATADNEYAAGYTGADNETIGSVATFFLRSGSASGTVTYTANATHPTNGRNFTKTLSFTVTEGPEPTVVQLDVIKPRNSLPVNNQNIDYFSGTPFMMETDIQFKDAFGNFTNPAGEPSIVNVSINPVNSLYFTTLDDPSTTDINEFLSPLAQGQINMVAGHGNMFLWSRDIAGTATVTVTAIELGSGIEFTYSFDIDVVNDGSNPGQPSDVSLSGDSALYINGSGGNTNQNTTVSVTAGNVPVLDPQVNNVKLSIITDAPNSGEKLTGTNVSGSSVQGTSINIATVNGIANALVQSGSSSNSIILTATVDRADNNVDNGIQDGLSTVKTYTVSDGVLWALELVSPALDAITVNAGFNSEGGIDYQDGTYSLVISAIATDKAGNPALPQTLQFGMINSPIEGYPNAGSGEFVHFDFDGDPREGASTFSSAKGLFLTAAGGVQPGDTLVVFGEESLGNEDLESAVTVGSVSSETSLSIVEKFNKNNETGTINNDFGVLPYAVGRAVDGNITATATTNAMGVATTRLNYPVSQLGRIAAIFVKGQGAINNGVAKSVTDVEIIAFPGVNGWNGQSSTLTVSPNIIPANTSVGFNVCLADSARNPLPGRFIAFSYVGANGSGSIDGISTVGIMNNPTGMDGCAYGIATTTGVIPGSSQPGFNFSSGGITCNLEDSGNEACLDVIAPENGVLNANPSAYIGIGFVNIKLTLYDGSGQPIVGASLSGACDAITGGVLGISSGPSLTDANGESSVRVSVSLDAAGGGLSGTCTFATASGIPFVAVNFSGRDSCLFANASPQAPPGACEEIEQFSVGGEVSGLGADPVVLQNNGGSDVIVVADGSFIFPSQDDSSVYLISVLTQPFGLTCSITNGLGTVSGANVTDVVVTCVP